MTRQVISFHYTLTDREGKTIDSSSGQNPLIFLQGSSQIIPGLEAALIAMNKGDKSEIVIPYQEAYGAYDQSLIHQVPRSKFPHQNINVGDMFQIGKENDYRVMMVIDLSEAEVTLDGNHPLAGQDLNFSVEIMDKRDATPEEIAHGHVHGAGGHHH